MRGSLVATRLRTKSSSAGFSGSIVKPPPPIARIVGVRPARRARSGGKDACRLFGPQVVDLERHLDDLAPDLLHPVGLRVLPRADGPVQTLADEVQRGAVAGREAAGHAARDRLVVGLAPASLLVVVHGVRARQQAKAGDRP